MRLAKRIVFFLLIIYSLLESLNPEKNITSRMNIQCLLFRQFFDRFYDKFYSGSSNLQKLLRHPSYWER